MKYTLLKLAVAVVLKCVSGRDVLLCGIVQYVLSIRAVALALFSVSGV